MLFWDLFLQQNRQRQFKAKWTDAEVQEEAGGRRAGAGKPDQGRPALVSRAWKDQVINGHVSISREDQYALWLPQSCVVK